MLIYPSLDYELNTQVRIHREANGYTQDEFAFLIGRDVADVMRYEDLTIVSALSYLLKDWRSYPAAANVQNTPYA